jgi:glycosyltransferase involved in cell wall biosynthesis
LKDENPSVDTDLTLSIQSSFDRRVRLTGFVLDQTDYVRAADIFVLPSRREGLSNSLLESMSAGLATVVTDYEWLKDIGEDGIDFLTFETGNAMSLARKLGYLIENPIERERIANSARARIQSSICISIIAGHYATLYDSLY